MTVYYALHLVWFVEIDENPITTILLHKIWKKVLLELECSRVISKRNWWTYLVACSRESISIFSLLIFNCVPRAHHQRCSPILFGITLEHSSTNSTFFQISILCSRIEVIEFSSISTNHTKYVPYYMNVIIRYHHISILIQARYKSSADPWRAINLFRLVNLLI